MSFNPLAPQGTLNRLVASVTWIEYPTLNVTPSFLNKSGITLSFDGETTKMLQTLTGVVQSPEPYQIIGLTINLLKTQSLASQYELQRQVSSLIGNGTVRPDTTALPPYDLFNCAILNVRELNFSGEDAGYSVQVGGYILINAALWA
jgi:hypothetical protein